MGSDASPTELKRKILLDGFRRIGFRLQVLFLACTQIRFNLNIFCKNCRKSINFYYLCTVIVGNFGKSTGFVPSCRDGN